jgi:uncharacterized protein (TIGR03118 family)
MHFRIRVAALAIVLLRITATVEGGSLPFSQVNLVANLPGVAQTTDPNLQNPWGVSFSSGSPFWVSDNASGLATLYSVNAAGTVSTQGLVVTIPFAPGTGGPGNPTGQVNNTGAGNSAIFNGNNFLFVSEDGTISGWRGALGTMAEVLQTGSSANVYKGVAEASIGTNTYLYAANFRNGSIDVLKANSGEPNLTGNFTDPGIPSGFAPFNIQLLGGKLYVTYALQDAAKHDDMAGPGNGFVDVFDTNGNLISRVASHGALNSPWGLAIAPSSFGSLAGDLLVGNFGDGKINAYNLATNAFDGPLTSPNGQPIDIPGLWTLTIGNGASAGSLQNLYFTAGPNDEMDGIFGVIAAVPEPSSIVHGVLALILGSLACVRRRLRLATVRA